MPPKQQRVARPAARYRPGKAPANANDYDSEEEEDNEEQQQQQQPDHQNQQQAGISSYAAATSQTRAVAEPSTQLLDEDSSEYETDTDEEPVAPAPKPAFCKPGAGTAAEITPAPVAVHEPESSEYETDSEEEESAEEKVDSLKPPTLFKPSFVPKRLRETIKDVNGVVPSTEEELEEKSKQIQAERKKEAHEIAAARIRAELASKEFDEAQPDLDDTDGKDPEAEFQEWRLRELTRIKRARDAEREREAEQKEIERRREMSEQERLKEDLEHARKTREEKQKQKGNLGFMEKYYHKGAFFQDMDILKRDYSGPTQDAIDKASLPKLMQVRDYGRKGRSKYTHLAAEDTTRQAIGAPGSYKSRGPGAGGPDRFQDKPHAAEPQLTGANDVAPGASGG